MGFPAGYHLRVGRFEDAIQWVMSGGRARRQCWAKVPEYTRTTPPMAYDRTWRIWLSDNAIMQGWGGQLGAADVDDPIRDGTYYQASNDDRLAADWELIEQPPGKETLP